MIWYKVGAADETPGKSGLAHFLEHLMFKGTAKNPTGHFSQAVARDRRRRRTPSPPTTTPAITSACRASSLKIDDGIRGRPHDRPAAHRRGGAARTRGHPGGAEPAHRQQSARAARRADRRRALPQPSLRQAGDRLAARDGTADARRRHRLLPALLRAQRRGGGDRRRRRAGSRAQDGAKRPTARFRATPISCRASVRRSRRRSRCAR